jgi:type I restriction enzyme, S subunit
VSSRGWNAVRLGDNCSKIGSGSTPRGGDSVYHESGVSFIRSQNVYNGLFNPDGLAHLDERQADQLKGVTVEPGDVLLNITGDSVARSCRVPDDVLPARVNQHVAIIRPRPEEFDSRFVGYYFISPFMQSTMLSLAGGGGTRKALTKEMIEQFKVPQPPRPDQERIADVLSAYDDLIENNRRRMALLEDAARQLYREWFVRLRFPGHEHTRITDGVPQGWERVPLGDRVRLNYGKALKAEDRVEGLCPVYGSSGIVGTHEKSLATAPGIVVGRKGNVGSVYWCTKDFWPIDTVYFINAEASDLWLYYSLQDMHFISTDVAVPGLNRDFAYSRPLLVPEPRIARDFLDAAVPLHEQITKLEHMNDKLRAARDLLLPRLMSGEIAA